MNEPNSASELAGVEHELVDVGEVRLHVAFAGSGPPVVLLHGFPEFWFSWRHQLPALAAAGLRVAAPDLRGYNESDKPRGLSAYRVERLVADIAGLVRHMGGEPVTLVGHDWGAALAWEVAMRHPELVERLAILNVPHPLRMLRGLRNWRQLKKSWYMFFFLLPRLPERWLLADGARRLRAMLRRDPVREGAFPEQDVARYVAAIQQPGAATASINYYRAALRRWPGAATKGLARIELPVLVLWGERDRYLGAELAEPPAEWVPDARVVRIPDASHWVQVDRPERVNELLLAFALEGERPD